MSDQRLEEGLLAKTAKDAKKTSEFPEVEMNLDPAR
jgi:hypothetical protein